MNKYRCFSDGFEFIIEADYFTVEKTGQILFYKGNRRELYCVLPNNFSVILEK